MSLLRFFKILTGSKGSTPEGAPTSTNQGADRQGVDVQIRNSDGSVQDGLATESTLSNIDQTLTNELPNINQSLTDIKSNQTNSDQLTKITDGAGVVNTKALGNVPTDGEVGLLTQSVLVGHSSAGGGTYEEVKVNPAGKLEVNDADVLTELQDLHVKFNPSYLSAFNVLETAERTPVIQGDFVYGINNQIWKYNYVFTVTAPGVAPANGDIYTNSNNSFTVIYSSGTTLVCVGTGEPTASGTLVRATGSGSTPITYSAYTSTAGNYRGTGATIDTNNGRLRIQSGTTSTGYAFIQSRRPIIYRAGQGSVALFTPVFTTGVANNIQLWGMGNIINESTINTGYFYGYNGVSFGIFHYLGGSLLSFIAQSDWNGDKVNGDAGTSFTYNPTFGTPVMIKYPYLGFGNVTFWIQNPNNSEWVLVHTIKYANTTNAVQLSNPSMHYMGYTINSGNTSNMTMYCGSVGVFISGVRSNITQPKGSISIRKDSITSTENCILNLRNALTFNGVPNRGVMRLTGISSGLKEATVVLVKLKRGCIINGTPVWSAVEGTISNNGLTITSGQSTISYDTAATTLSGGQEIEGFSLGNGGTLNQPLTPDEIFIAPGEQLTITGVASGNSTVNLSLSWILDI